MVDFAPEPPPSTAQDHPTMTWVHRQLQRVASSLKHLRDDLQYLIYQFLIPNFVYAAHGTMYNTLPVVGPNIPAGDWLTVSSFDTTASVKRIAFDVGASTWTYENAGVFQVSVELVLTHNESNQGRSFYVRLNDGTAAGLGVPVAVGRNQPGTNLSISFLQDIAIDEPSRTFFLEVGNGDALGAVVWDAASLTIVNVGGWIDEVPTQ